MSITDILLVVVILAFVGMGAMDGFVHTLGRLIGSVAGFMIALHWSSWLSGILAIALPAGWARVIAFCFVFAVIGRLVGFATMLIDKIFKFLTILPFLKSIDRVMGAILGLGESVILLGGLIYLVTTFKPVPFLYSVFTASPVANWIDGVFHNLLGILLK